jgi:hypothetical protein
VKVVAVTFQLSEAWKDGKPLYGKYKTTNVSIWHELSIMSLVLVPGETEPPAPAALVMKESTAKSKWNKETKRKETQRRLPFKLPVADMWHVYNYLEHPANFVDPPKNEILRPGELDPYLPTFGKEQLRIILAMSELAAKNAEAMAAIDPDAPAE